MFLNKNRTKDWTNNDHNTGKSTFNASLKRENVGRLGLILHISKFAVFPFCFNIFGFLKEFFKFQLFALLSSWFSGRRILCEFYVSILEME